MSHRIADLTSCEKNPYGLIFHAYDVDSEDIDTQRVEIQLTTTDLAFVIAEMISHYGLDNVRRAIDHMAGEDPTGRCVTLSEPARILERGREN
jgi:hypothetical protein